MKKEKNRQIIEHRFYDLPADVPALLLTGDKWKISEKRSSRYHFHNCTEIGFCHSGEGTIEFENGDIIKFMAGDVTIIPRYLPHTTYSAKGSRSLWSYIFIDLSSMLSPLLFLKSAESGLSIDDEVPANCLFREEEHPHIHFLASCMLEEMLEQKADWTSLFKSSALSLHYRLQRLKEEKRSDTIYDSNSVFATLKPAIDYISQHYTGKIVIKDLATLCHLSENHFRRQFLSIMGTSPLAFINFTRINQACIMLSTTNRSVLTIAEEVGFHSVASFNRNFKELLGLSPNEYRKKSAAKLDLPIHHRFIKSYQGWTQAEVDPD